MKRSLLFFALAICSCALFAQDTITGWSFPVNAGTDSLNANFGTTQNKGYDLRFQWTTPNDSTINSIFFTDGSTSYAAATTGWDNGANDKYWSVKFKASTYGDIKVSSKQKGIFGSYDPGPGQFKLQWKLSGGEWADITGGTIQVANDWTTGKVDTLPIPVSDQGTTSIYIRWLSTTNLDINGAALTANGISMIDDILVTGRNTSGINDIIYTNRVNVYPVPNHGSFTVDSKVALSSLAVYDVLGKRIYTCQNPGLKNTITLPGASKGTYFLKIGFSDTDKQYTVKFQID
jgi:hypothetical protein